MNQIPLNLLRALAICFALNLQFASTLAQGASFTSLTITNPAPRTGDRFGYSVAAVGADRVLVGAFSNDTGATNAGAAYLFSTNGMLLTTFTNPTPAFDDRFGYSVAAVGADRVLVGAFSDDTGATNAGAAYLFSTNGMLLTTFTNPTPADYDSFSISVAAVGNNRVLIGAHQDDTSESDAGIAYLYNTNGALLTTFTNPTPAAGEQFGYSVAAVGSDQVLIGTPSDSTGAGNAGVAYLFSINGTLLMTITNPAPANSDQFGWSVGAVGSDMALIGAPFKGSAAGAAYLFSTDGMLLTTFTNPTPTPGDVFGWSVAAMGTDKVLIGAHGDDTGAMDAGAVYLFSTNGALLTTFTNPVPANSSEFGYSVAAVGTDNVLIGAHGDDTGGQNVGAAYLFSAEKMLSMPSLTIYPTTSNTVAVSWLSPSTGWMLQENTNSVGSVNWSNVSDGILEEATNKIFIVNPPIGNRYYRLFKQ